VLEGDVDWLLDDELVFDEELPFDWFPEPDIEAK
jgi:hypothetical protein